MGLSKYKLGKLIERVETRNSDLKYGFDDVRGVSNNKKIQPTKANISDRSFVKFYVVHPKEFVFNRRTTRMGERLGLGFNNTERAYIFTEDYVAFRVKDDEVLLSDYLYIYFLRPEFDRYVRYDSWESATEFFNWEEMCDVTISLPSRDIQQKYVDVYNSMLANQRTYERGLVDLKLTCDAYIDELRRDLPHTAIGQFINPCETKNENLKLGLDSVKGVSIRKRFIETKANMGGVSLKPYILVSPDAFCYVTVTSRNGNKISFAHNNSDDTYIVSSSYTVFEVNNKKKLLPSYLELFVNRTEFDRYSRFHSWGSARETFNWEDMREVKIPIPDINIQQSIVDIYNAYLTRRDINENLKANIKDICPILIKGSLEEAQRS